MRDTADQGLARLMLMEISMLHGWMVCDDFSMRLGFPYSRAKAAIGGRCGEC